MDEVSQCATLDPAGYSEAVGCAGIGVHGLDLCTLTSWSSAGVPDEIASAGSQISKEGFTVVHICFIKPNLLQVAGSAALTASHPCTMEPPSLLLVCLGTGADCAE